MNLFSHVSQSPRSHQLGYWTLACLALLLSLSFGSTGSAQEPKPTNLKVLDSTISHDQLIAIMGKFTSALGVGCDHCHAQPAPGSREPNFASDDNKLKLTARSMMQMVNKINGAYISSLPTGDTPRVVVECVTCHHGQPEPVLIQDVLKKARKEHGMAAVDSTYRELRKQYYGSFTYDFDERALVQFALGLLPESNADAMAVLDLNKEFNPKSYANEWAMGRVYAAKGDTASAIAAYKRSLEINPDFRRAQRELQALGAK